jgi:glycosyltransferase involved in cell wall biosynthesis
MEDSRIKVSVALVVYNHEKYLRQAIESILMQEVNFIYDIVVGEDNSTDNSRDILLEYKNKHPNKFILIFQDENVGGTKNIYNIFMKARGEYIAILEGDDYWLDRNKLQKQVDYLENNIEYLGVSHVIEARDIQGNYISKHPISSIIVGKDATIELFLKGYYFSAVATVFRNIFLDKPNDYSILYKANKHVGDFTLCLLLLDKGKIKVLDETMSVYRSRSVEGEGNYNSIRNAYQQYSDHIQLINQINSYFKYKYNFSKEYNRRSSKVFLYSIRHFQIKHFNKTFKLIPLRNKIYFYLCLPIDILKILFQKLIIKSLVKP